MTFFKLAKNCALIQDAHPIESALKRETPVWLTMTWSKDLLPELTMLSSLRKRYARKYKKSAVWDLDLSSIHTFNTLKKF
jgi:hypothetical protein